jgi:LuxR family transcriptional regulator of csgAB operon
MAAISACRVSERPEMVDDIALWLVDEAGENKALSQEIGRCFASSCTLATLSALENNQLNLSFQHFFLINCEAYSPEDIRLLFWRFHSLNDRVRFVLFNVATLSQYEEFVEWPQLVGMLAENCSDEHLMKSITEVLNGGHWLPRHLISRILQTKRQAPGANRYSDTLTRREVQILEHLNEGLTNQEIGEMIHVSGHTVRTHLYNVYKKIGVKNRMQACNWLKQNLY